MNAQFYLGVCYECGEGIEQNYEKAAEWYIKAAEQGMPEAQFNIAMFYKYGDGVNKDLAEWVKWLTKAAEQGDPKAIEMLKVLK